MISTRDSDTETGARDRALIDFLYATACQVSEARDLDTDDIDFVNGVARIGVRRRSRVLALGDAAQETMSAYLDKWRRASRVGQHSGPFFLNRDGNRLSARAILDVVLEAGLAVGIKGCNPRRLRDASASHMAAHGMDEVTLQRVLGNATLGTTKIYTQVTSTSILAAHRRFQARAPNDNYSANSSAPAAAQHPTDAGIPHS